MNTSFVIVYFVFPGLMPILFFLGIAGAVALLKSGNYTCSKFSLQMCIVAYAAVITGSVLLYLLMKWQNAPTIELAIQGLLRRI